MLTALDHTVLICRNIDDGVAAYSALLGMAPAWRAVDTKSGTASALFSVANTAIELLAPIKDRPAEARFHALLKGQESRLTSLAFTADNIDSAHHVFTRRGLAPSPIAHGSSQNTQSGAKRDWRRFRCADAACAEIKTFILSPPEPPLAPPNPPLGCVTAMDHLVINTPNPERATAHYGARLGLRFALDRTIKAFHTRFLFFRIGGLTLEIIHRTEQKADPNTPDTLWGITWRVDDLEKTHHRLAANGLEISAIREGRKPGTRVFTVHDGTLGIPTLCLAKI